MGQLADALDAAKPARGGGGRGGCGVGRYFATIEDEDDKAKLREKLAEHPQVGISNPALAQILTRMAGRRISTFVVGNHRSGLCQCKEIGLV